MPRTTIVEIPPAEQVRMRAELRRARYGYLLALHLLLLCAAGRTPSEALIAYIAEHNIRPGEVEEVRFGQSFFQRAKSFGLTNALTSAGLGPPGCIRTTASSNPASAKRRRISLVRPKS